MAIGNNYNRWGNFNNQALYDKYKRSQGPVASAPSQQQQQQGGNEWSDLGKNIGDTWRESLAKRNDGEFAGQKMSRVGLDQSVSDEQLANLPKGFQTGYNAEQGAMQTFAHPETAMNTFGDNTGATYADMLAKEYGTNAMTEAGKQGMSGIAEGIGSNIATDVSAEALANASANLGANLSADAITAGVTDAAAEGATAGAGSALGSVLGPLGAAYGIYSLGNMFDWW